MEENAKNGLGINGELEYENVAIYKSLGKYNGLF